MEKSVAVSVENVTVYPDRARVTCRGDLVLEQGMVTLVVDELPLTLEGGSLRSRGKGAARVRMMGIDMKRVNYAGIPHPQIKQIIDQIQVYQDQNRIIEDQKASLLAHGQYLDGLRKATDQYAKGLARGMSNVEDQLRLITFLQEQDEAMRAEIRELDKQQRDLNQEIAKLQQDLKQLQSQRGNQLNQARVEIEVNEAGSFQLELSYVVHQASWTPLYDLRLTETEDEKALELGYLAQVTQRTGQDWNGVKLTLSTARPALNQRLPKLQPWYVDVFQPRPEMMKQARPMMTRAAAAPAADAFAAEAVSPEPVAAEIATAEVVDAGTSVQFNTSGNIDIPSDGSPHKTTISYYNLPAKLDYLSVPKHTDAVFRRVTATNTSTAPFLAGEASLFVNDEYIGSTRLEYVPRNGEFEMMLGVEERITISRELVKREVDKKLLRDQRLSRFGYAIEVENLLAKAVQLEVQDHVPNSRHEQIKVKLERIAPNPTERSDLNMLEWVLNLAPKSKQTISYDFQVEHPTSLNVVGLNI